MKPIIYLYIILVFIFLIPVAYTYSQQMLSLEEAIRIGMENNYSIRLVKQDEKLADNNVTYGNAGFLPRVDLNLGQDFSNQGIKAVFITEDELVNSGAKSNSTSAAAQLTWTLFDGMKMFTTYKKLEEFRNLGEINTRVQVENTVANIMAVYYEIIQQKRRINVIKSSLELSRDRMNLAQEKYTLGSGSQREKLLASVDVNADSSALIQQEELLIRTKVNLNRLLGRNPEESFTVSDEIELLEKLDLSMLKSNMARNPMIQQVRQNQVIANLEMKEIKSERLPFLNLNLGYSFNRSASEAGFLLSNRVNGVNYGVAAGMNLFNGMNLQRRLQNAEINLETNALQMEDLRNQLETTLFSTYLVYENNLRLLALEEENLSVSRQNLDISRQTYDLGELSSIEYRETQKNHVESENRLIEALFRVKISEIELLRLSGGIID